jgi:hypothetical protein
MIESSRTFGTSGVEVSVSVTRKLVIKNPPLDNIAPRGVVSALSPAVRSGADILHTYLESATRIL